MDNNQQETRLVEEKIQIKPVPVKSKMFGLPSWYHLHGSKICVEEFRARDCKLMLKGSAAGVLIKKHLSSSGGWMIHYFIQYSAETGVKGIIFMNTNDIKTAFGLSECCEEFGGQHLLDEFGGDVAQQGKYIRSQNYLNIPGPGTGHDGDANISIWTDDDIKAAVAKLIAG